MAAGNTIYSGAYIMPSGGRSSEHARKHEMHLDLLHKILCSGLAERLSEAKSLRRVFEMLREWPTFGDFLAFQYSIDLNYSEVLLFDENDFVVAGPGAKEGIQKCFSDMGGLSESDVIRLVTDRQAECLSAIGLGFPSLWGRPLKLIDCQNLFCEVSKYARLVHPEFSGISGRRRIKQKFRPSLMPLTVWYPPKWGIAVSNQSAPLAPEIRPGAG
jgi:5-hmdU DNA kinase, helical domain